MKQQAKHYKHSKPTPKYKRILWIVMLFLTLCILFLCNLKVEIDTSNVRTKIEYGETNNLPEAYLSGKVIVGRITKIPINKEKSVITNAVGTNENKYSANFLFWKNMKTVPVTIEDNNPPMIQLTYDSNHYTESADKYIEEGFVAQDNYDGYITQNVQVQQKEDVIIYTVEDSSQNETVVERILKYNDINAKLKEPLKNGKLIGEGKTIYLTFDDGPSIYTHELLETLKQNDVKATFFVVGNKGYNGTIKDIVNQGHSIAVHSTTHSYSSIYQSKEAFFADLYNMQEIIEKESGIKTYLMRFPGGSSNAVSKKYCKGIMSQLVTEVQKQGFHYFDWNVSSGDGGGVKTTEQVYENVINGIKSLSGDAVVLQHDTQKYSIDAVDKIIRWGKVNGYQFKSISMETKQVHHGVIN